MPKYEIEIDSFKELDFQQMSLEECAQFIQKSYNLLENLTYDRFKYALFPSFFAFDLTRAIKKVNKNYTTFDLYWGLNNKTSVVTEDMFKIANQINQDLELKRAIINGMDYLDLCQNYPEFKEMTDIFLKKHGFKSDYNCYCFEGQNFFENPERMVKIVYPLVREGSVEDKSNKDFSEITNALRKRYGSKYPKLEKKIKQFRYFHVVREQSQYLWEALFYYVRQCVKRINLLLLGNEDYKAGVTNIKVYIN